MTNVNPEEIMGKAGGFGGGACGGHGVSAATKVPARDRRPNHPKLEPGKFKKVGADLAGELLLDAIYAGNMRGIMQLVGQGADPNYQDDEESSPIMEAAALGRVDAVKFLLKKGRVNPLTINWADNDGHTALSEAKAIGHKEIVGLLMAAGAKEGGAIAAGGAGVSATEKRKGY